MYQPAEFLTDKQIARLRGRRAGFVDARKAEPLILWTADLSAIGLAFFLGSDYRALAEMVNVAPRISLWFERGVPSHLICYLAAASVLVYWFWERGHYTRRLPFWEEQRVLLATVLSAAMVELVLVVLLSEARLAKGDIAKTWLWAWLLLAAARWTTKSLMISVGLWKRPTLLVGDGDNARRVYRVLRGEKLLGYEVVAWGVLLETDVPPDGAIEEDGARVPVVALGEDPRAVVIALGHPEVVLALESLRGQENLATKLNTSRNEVLVIPSIRGLPLLGMEVVQVMSHDLLFLRVRNNLAKPGMLMLKRLFDLAASALIVLTLWWLYAYIYLRIRATGGPAIYGHTRIGRDGRKFVCYKFRTMVPDSERVLRDLLATNPDAAAEWEQNFKLKNDPRITRIGAFLRRTSLDELPQIWNVIRGDMSLVGPRPIVEAELERYGEGAWLYLQTRPGITGIWQVSGRNDTSYAERVSLDTWYVRNWSLWYDMVVLLKTIKIVFRREGAY
jgi:undecaprenyl-phosphate galactose phosphotransferase